VRAVLDTNILIDYLAGVEQAAAELRRYRVPLVSRISWIEVLAGAVDEPEEPIVRAFLERLRLVEITAAVAEEAVRIRQERHLRLPEAIILATARVEGCQLVTRNTRDFSVDWPEIREPYRLA
jgi:predicted nucleic acid-binding protein